MAVEHLKVRLSDAFDRFLDGVADNRQVVFDDDGWRLKTDPAEPPDPAQSDRLAELHRWLDSRSYSRNQTGIILLPASVGSRGSVGHATSRTTWIPVRRRARR